MRAFIAGCAGLTLSESESAFFRESDPWGFIIFGRNCDSPKQLRRLTDGLRESVGRDAPILTDQEGGRVARLNPPGWPVWPTAGFYGDMHRAGGPAIEAVRLGSLLMAAALRESGIDVNCLPVLDVAAPGGDPVIGDRSYGNDAESVSVLGSAAAESLLQGGVVPVMKHIPGHGRAPADSHHSLPVVSASAAELEQSDFAPFRALHHLPMAMTAHVQYQAIDPAHPATLSAIVIREVIRGHIGFGGLLLSDDISMGALGGSPGGSLEERSRGALKAGCDVVLHCTGNLAEMEGLAADMPLLSGESARRAQAVEAARCPPEPLNVAQVREQFDRLLSASPVRS